MAALLNQAEAAGREAKGLHTAAGRKVMAQRAWFITGVSRGFGREMTEQLLERGDRVAGTVRNLGSVRALTERYGDRFWTAHLDVTDTAGIRKVVDAAFSALGPIDV